MTESLTKRLKAVFRRAKKTIRLVSSRRARKEAKLNDLDQRISRDVERGTFRSAVALNRYNADSQRLWSLGRENVNLHSMTSSEAASRAPQRPLRRMTSQPTWYVPGPGYGPYPMEAQPDAYTYYGTM